MDLNDKIQSILSEDSAAKLKSTFESGKNPSGGTAPTKDNQTKILQAPGYETLTAAGDATGKATHPMNDSKAKSSTPSKSTRTAVEEIEALTQGLEDVSEEETVDEGTEEVAEAKDESEDDKDDKKEDSKDEKKPNPFKKGKKGVNPFAKKDDSDKSDKSDKKKDETQEESVQVHIDAMFNGEDLSEDFKTKAATIFAAALAEREEAIRAQVVADYEETVAESVAAVQAELSEQLDGYLNYVADSWLEENRVQVENGLKLEITESFIEGLRGLFLEHDIDVPESKSNLVEELAARIETLEAELNEQLNENVELAEKNAEYQKGQTVAELGESLSDTNYQKFVNLCEGVSYSSVEEFAKKASLIKENYFSGTKTTGKASTKVLTEGVNDRLDGEEIAEESAEVISEEMQQLAQAASRYSGKM